MRYDSDFEMDPKVLYLFLLGILAAHVSTEDAEMKNISDFLKKFSNLNVEEILSNERLFQAYHKCFMEEGPCTPDARDMKNVIPILVRSACEACTDEQKREMKRHLDYAKHNRQKEWDQLLDKYDPKREGLEKFLANVPQ